MAKCSKTLGENIARLIREKGFKQNQVADRAGVTAAYLSQVKNAVNTNPGIEQLEWVANALGVPLVELLREPGEKTGPQVHKDVEDCLKRVTEHVRASKRGKH